MRSWLNCWCLSWKSFPSSLVFRHNKLVFVTVTFGGFSNMCDQEPIHRMEHCKLANLKRLKPVAKIRGYFCPTVSNKEKSFNKSTPNLAESTFNLICDRAALFLMINLQNTEPTRATTSFLCWRTSSAFPANCLWTTRGLLGTRQPWAACSRTCSPACWHSLTFQSVVNVLKYFFASWLILWSDKLQC